MMSDYKKSKCKICKKEVPDYNMDFDHYVWECYDCQDKYYESSENKGEENDS
tara:strand:- start:280 stop:435 length:156 start_codon:yes stop_codon:yes gene_type:complete